MNPISWQTYEFEHNVKNVDWFWITGIIGITFSILAIMFDNILFAVLIVLATVLLILLGNKEPKLLDCEINKKGVRVHKTIYLFANLDSFNVTEGHSPKLILKSSKLLMPLIIIPVGDVYPEEIIETLKEIIKHDEKLHEPFAHVLMDYLGF